MRKNNPGTRCKNPLRICTHPRHQRKKNRKMNPQTPPEEEFTIKILSIPKSSKSCSRQPPQHHKKPPRFPKPWRFKEDLKKIK
ncbi:MAG: hypothetical protein GDA51_02320 [Ekhidna sp.]|nr:hypothetical protein [Ekhidna sp.]